MRKNHLVIFFLFIGIFVQAQDASVFVCPVTDSDGNLLANPFVGGLDSPQFNQTDFDDDGDQDVVVFDKPGNVFSVFLYEDGNYTYNYDLHVHFDALRNWVRFYDYNGDGVKDIFTSPSETVLDGVEVWTGKRNGNIINYELFKFDLPRGNVLQHSFNQSTTPVFVSAGDIPSVDDIDGDGDVDIISFDPGGSYVTMYRNYSIERGLGLDTFDMEYEENCFGKFYENSFSQEISLSDDANECAIGFKGDDDSETRNLHAGSTITSIDMDNDNDKDLLIGDLANNHIVLLVNGGDQQDAWMTEQDVTFPSYNVPVDMPIFLGSHVLDVDQDGKDDLVLSPSQDNVNANVNNAWYYRNIATDGSFDFSLQQKDFLGNEMLDFGSFSSPDFVDVDQDGLLDIIVGTSGVYSNNGSSELRMQYLRNIGTLQSPAFEVADDNWLNFSQFTDISSKPSPSFGDLDSDGDIDLLVGDNKGFFYYYENIAGEGNPLAFANPIYEYQDLKVGTNVRVALVDLNEDGLTDLVIGEQNNNGSGENRGSLNYLQNIGSVGNPLFEPNTVVAPNTPILGGVNVQEEFVSTRPSASPRFFKTEDDFFLIVGNDAGRLKLYNNVLGNIDGEFNLIDNDFLNLRQGERSVPAVADIDNDGFFELVTGNYRGGLSFFNTPIIADSMVNTDEDIFLDNVRIFPNPASDMLTVSSEINIDKIEIFDVSGRLIMGIEQPDNQLSIAHISSGIYIVNVFTGSGVSSKKVVIQ